MNEHIKKGWGQEIIITNNEKYCGKLLCFNEGAMFSMHYHMIKDETWYVNSGKFIYRWIDTNTADLFEETLDIGNVVNIPPGLPHQLECIEEGVIFEVSTQHFDNDSYRVWKGDSQNKK
jgi:mannose-6-phosphate isomerase-like protein (cupin superfamily)